MLDHEAGFVIGSEDKKFFLSQGTHNSEDDMDLIVESSLSATIYRSYKEAKDLIALNQKYKANDFGKNGTKLKAFFAKAKIYRACLYLSATPLGLGYD